MDWRDSYDDWKLRADRDDEANMREIDDGGLAETLKKLAGEIEELKYQLSVAHEMLDKLQDTAYAVLEVWDRHGFGYDLSEPIEVMRQQLEGGK